MWYIFELVNRAFQSGLGRSASSKIHPLCFRERLLHLAQFLEYIRYIVLGRWTPYAFQDKSFGLG
jgi:hypothetical protein